MAASRQPPWRLALSVIMAAGVAAVSTAAAPRFPHQSQAAAAAAVANWAPQRRYNWTERFYEQTLDHFSFGSDATFRQRYLLNDGDWGGADAGAPIFVYCGNEGDVAWFAQNTGFMWEIAPRFGALLVFPEHRYYGKSIPEAAVRGVDGESLAFLTAEQALADLAALVTDLKTNLSAQASPVVVFGGSYGGMLAAWFRLKYPHVATGALASSAPILQFEDFVPPDTFYRIVSEDFRRESETCFHDIRQSWALIDAVGSSRDGLQELRRTFHLCSDLNSTEELKNWLEEAYSFLAMVDYPVSASFMMPLPAYPIREVMQATSSRPSASAVARAVDTLYHFKVRKEHLNNLRNQVCRAMDGLQGKSSILERVFAGVSVYYNHTGAADCFAPGDDPHGMSGWDYQACTEMVMPMASNANNSMFPPFRWDPSAYADRCVDQFGVRPRPDWIPTEFGGKDIKRVLRDFASNIIFSNGLLDPWSGGGVLENISRSVVALTISDGAHHLDLRASTPDDPPSVQRQRETECRIIQGWLDAYAQADARSLRNSATLAKVA
eukprot:SM000022S07220  [mRNA]  locus=s22:604238:608027:+ [translate_table: standard]